MEVNGELTMKYTTYWAVYSALYRLRAFDPARRRATKQVIDASSLSDGTVRKALNGLQQAGVVGRHPSALKQRGFWVGRKMKGRRTTSYNRHQYISDANNVQTLAQSNATANALLGSANLTSLDMNDETHRKIFNAIVNILTQAGYNGLPTYGITAGSFYWWLLKALSRGSAASMIQKLRANGQLP
jgi:hypothetical protein